MPSTLAASSSAAGPAPAPPAPGAPTLTATQRATLAAVVARVLDGALTLAPALDAVAIVEARLARMPAHKLADLRLVLDLFGARAAALVTCGVPVPFARLDAARQDRMLAAWGRSRVPVQRTVFQALRRVTLAAWYGVPAVQRALGYLGPLHERTPSVPWEGPLPGVARDDDPVARGVAWAAAREMGSALADRGGGGPSGANGDASGDADGDARRGAPPDTSDSAAPPGDHHHPDAPRFVATPSALLRAATTTTPADARGRIVPGAAVAADLRLAADAVVVGTGAGGAVAAARLAEAGLHVVVLEEGGLFTSVDFDEREAALAERLYAEQGLRATEDLAVTMFQGTTVGGSTTVNWMIMLRPPAHVLAEWARRFGCTPLAGADFQRALDRVATEVHARLVPDDAHSPSNRVVLDGARALGWRARAGMVNAHRCVRAGFCGQGCRYDAKQGTLVTYVPRALAAGAALYCDTTAVRVELRERDAGAAAARRPPLKRVVAEARDGATGARRGTVTVDAPIVVLAGGAVGTPSLLIRSGLGGGGVGRWLRLHPTTAIPALYHRPMHGGSGLPMTTLVDHFADAGPGGYGFWIETPPSHPMLAAVAASGFGRAHAEFARQYTHFGTLIALVRDGGDPALSNGAVTVDRRGRTRLRYRLGPTDGRHLAQGIAAAARLHLAAGAREVRTLHTDPVVVRAERDLAAIARRSRAANDLTVFSAHVNGTCRMGTDPRTSGCTPAGERHGVRGLYVADGSLLPTGLGVNPQHTIMALASVVADGIVAAW